MLNFMRALQLRRMESDRALMWGRDWKQRIIRRGEGKGLHISREDYKRNQISNYEWNMKAMKKEGA